MTGEITLRGEVLPIGGLKEKLLAAGRGGIKQVLIPEENVKDLTEISDEIKNRLDIHPVRWIEEVLERALERQPQALAEVAGRRAAAVPARRSRSRLRSSSTSAERRHGRAAGVPCVAVARTLQSVPLAANKSMALSCAA